jgi:hypothetical protein
MYFKKWWRDQNVRSSNRENDPDGLGLGLMNHAILFLASESYFYAQISGRSQLSWDIANLSGDDGFLQIVDQRNP